MAATRAMLEIGIPAWKTTDVLSAQDLATPLDYFRVTSAQFRRACRYIRRGFASLEIEKEGPGRYCAAVFIFAEEPVCGASGGGASRLGVLLVVWITFLPESKLPRRLWR